MRYLCRRSINETPPYIKRSPELSQVAARYSAWLKKRLAFHLPRLDGEVNVLGLDAITCTGLSPQSASSALHEDGIDCTKPDVPQFILRLNFMHPEKIWHDADDGWAKLNDSFKDAHGVTLDERLIVKISPAFNSIQRRQNLNANILQKVVVPIS